jgi:hypothetical protein
VRSVGAPAEVCGITEELNKGGNYTSWPFSSLLPVRFLTCPSLRIGTGFRFAMEKLFQPEFPASSFLSLHQMIPLRVSFV